jgi:hypothetical protein
MTKKTNLRLTAADFDGLKDGKRHTYRKGDLVALSAAQTAAFFDKFEDPRVQEELVAKAARDKVIRDKLNAVDKEAADKQRKEIEAEAQRQVAAEAAAKKAASK